jgi:hypothetical protein
MDPREPKSSSLDEQKQSDSNARRENQTDHNRKDEREDMPAGGLFSPAFIDWYIGR